MVFEVPVVPFAIPSLSSVLAVLCHRNWETVRIGLVEREEEGRARRRARQTLERDAIVRSVGNVVIC